MWANITRLWIQYLKPQIMQKRFTVSLGSLILYLLVFVIFYHYLGVSITAFSVLPIAIMAWFYGWHVGIMIGLLSLALNTLLLNMVGHMGLGVVFYTGGAPNFISHMLIAIGVGKTSEMHRENKQAQVELAQENSLLTKVLDNIPIDVFAKDTESRFIYANASTRRAKRVTSLDKLIGKTDFDFMVNKLDEAKQHFDIEQAVIRTGKPSLDKEFSGPDPDGKLVWGMSSKMPFYDINGNILGIVGINRGITLRKEMEEALQQSEESLRKALEAAEMRTWRWDLLQNQVVAKGVGLLGFSRTEYQITYQEFLESVHSEDREKLQQAFNNVINEGMAYDVEYRIISPDNIIHWMASKGDVEQNKDGKPIAVNGISYDITEHKQAEEHHLKLALERERIQLLANFITQASHEFRTPLSIIATSVYILQKTDDANKQQQYFHRIEQQVKNISQLIDNLSTLSKLDSHQSITLKTVDLNQMLHNMYPSKQILHKNKNIECLLELSSIPLSVRGNVDYLEQAISHIWNNAIPHTPHGKQIAIRSQQIDNTAIIEIADTGMGISDDDLPHIFTRFYRADKAGSTRGFGLGLPIAKVIIERLDGQIKATSEIEKGSMFRISLPLMDPMSDNY
jgi:PAS domain S-box-containing protein